MVERTVSAGDREIFDLDEFLSRPLYAHLAHDHGQGCGTRRFGSNGMARPPVSSVARSFGAAPSVPFSLRHFGEGRVFFPPLVKGGPGGVVGEQSGTFLQMFLSEEPAPVWN
jgi:hypothetical protein